MGSMPHQTSQPKRVLLLTNSEHGQANVYLATAHALLTLPDADVEVHFASFSPIQKYVSSTSAHALSSSPGARPIIFHTLSGLDMLSAWSRPEFEAEKDGSRHAQGLSTAWRKMQILLKVTLPWSGPEFVEVFDSICEIVRRVDPHVTAVDPAFSPGLTALRWLGGRYIVLSPNTIKDFAMPAQPNAEALWKYPCIGAAFPYPIPAKYIPLNILLVLFALFISLIDPHRRALQAYLLSHSTSWDKPIRLTTLNDISLGPPSPGVKFLVANRLALEFPLKNLPAHIIPCGPIIRPAASVDEVDPELAAWLRGGKTVYVNLGTHVLMTEDSAVEMATAVRILLDHARSVRWRDKRMDGLRVLWKLNLEKGEIGEGSRIKGILGRDLESGAVRIVRWIEAEPIAVLAERNVVAAVHHGGANSFLEAASAGIPQVVLPVWMDTFDFARRAELLGIGRWGNKVTHKGAWGGELGNVLIEVLLGGQSGKMKERAEELAKLCNENGGGRVIAARTILREIREDEESQEPALHSEGEEDDLISQSTGVDWE